MAKLIHSRQFDTSTELPHASRYQNEYSATINSIYVTVLYKRSEAFFSILLAENRNELSFCAWAYVSSYRENGSERLCTVVNRISRPCSMKKSDVSNAHTWPGFEAR